jgi:aspartate 4-decarboxylase
MMEYDLALLKKLSPFEFKNILNFETAKAYKKHLQEGGQRRLLNSGRGNPNFLNTTIRNAFSYLELFVSHLSGTYLPDVPNLGLRPRKKGIAQKLDRFLRSQKNVEEIVFLRKAIHFAIHGFDFDPDEFVFELCDAVIGDYYPSPPRILIKTEQIIKAYFDQILGHPSALKKRKFDLFATEGASAAMIYLFNSLKVNKILKSRDEIAIWTPIFAPYLELPLLSNYNLRTTFLESRADLDWQLPDQELDKLKNPKIKALFIVNPTNPTSVAIDKKTIEKIARIVKTYNKDLIVIVDTVYCTFVENYHCFLTEMPENTVFIYSFSKYLGGTGWRLGIIMLDENNVIDKMIARLGKKETKQLYNRYKLVTFDPASLKFIDRLEADSREESLAHTGGLSCPQQAIMCLFCLFHLMDENLTYRATIRQILIQRAKNLYSNLGIAFEVKPNHTYYYAVIDIAQFARDKYGSAFGDYFAKNVHILQFLLKLAREKMTICLSGAGFHGPESSLRVSLANMDDEAYIEVGKNIKNLIHEYYEAWKQK